MFEISKSRHTYTFSVLICVWYYGFITVETDHWAIAILHIPINVCLENVRLYVYL